MRRKIRHILIRILTPPVYWAGKRTGRREMMSTMNAQLTGHPQRASLNVTQIINLCRRSGWSEEQIARSLNIPISTLKYFKHPVRNQQ